MMEPKVTVSEAAQMLLTLRRQLAHALKQPNISPIKFNAIREQILPLDKQLRDLGQDPEALPQMAPTFVTKPSRFDRRRRKVGKSWSEATMQRMCRERSRRDE